MNIKRYRYAILMALLIALLVTTVAAQDSDDAEDLPTEFHIRGTNVMTIGQYPDSFTYDGSGTELLEEPGFFELHVDAENDLGLMFARFYVTNYQLDATTLLEEAQITVIYPVFGTPTGVMPDYWEGGLADYTLLHGDSGQEAPVLPTVYNDVASWGPALLFIDGELYAGPEEMLGGPNPLGALSGHMMYSNEVRDPDTGLVTNEAGDEPFNPMTPGDGDPFEETAELLHLVIHTEERDTEAFPPFTMFMHVNFLNVEAIDPIDGLDFLTFEAVAELSQDDIDSLYAEWLDMIDGIETAIAEAAAEDAS